MKQMVPGFVQATRVLIDKWNKEAAKPRNVHTDITMVL
jgi:hypothetical protein